MNSPTLSEHKQISDWETKETQRERDTLSSLRRGSLADSVPRGLLGPTNQTSEGCNLIPDLAFKSAANLLVCAGFISKIHIKQRKNIH